MKGMMKVAAGALVMSMALGSSACVVFVDDEPVSCGASADRDHDRSGESDRYDEHANWGWHGDSDECDDDGEWTDANDEYGWNNTTGDSNNGGGSNNDSNSDGGSGDTTGGDHDPEDCPSEGQVCGEDGETYESACEASRAHVRVASEGACLPPCAEDLDCADGSLCEAGSCQEVTCPDLAEDDHSLEVCAEDGFTYQTSCEARMARLSVAHEGCCVE